MNGDKILQYLSKEELTELLSVSFDSIDLGIDYFGGLGGIAESGYDDLIPRFQISVTALDEEDGTTIYCSDEAMTTFKIPKAQLGSTPIRISLGQIIEQLNIDINDLKNMIRLRSLL